jgi:hypothetical protein
MIMASPLDDWKFLVGEWKGETKSAKEFGEEEKIEGKATFAFDPSDRFITSRGETWSVGKLVNKSISIMFYDGVEQKLKRKTFFSYGFVNNEVELSRNDSEIKFEVTIEPVQRQFEGTRWRSFIRKISDTKIAVGLEIAKGEEPFRAYGEEILTKRT